VRCQSTPLPEGEREIYLRTEGGEWPASAVDELELALYSVSAPLDDPRCSLESPGEIARYVLDALSKEGR